MSNQTILKVKDLTPSQEVYYITTEQYLSLANDKIEELIGERVDLSIIVDDGDGFANIIVDDSNPVEIIEKVNEMITHIENTYDFTMELMSRVFSTDALPQVDVGDYYKEIKHKNYDDVLISIICDL